MQPYKIPFLFGAIGSWLMTWSIFGQQLEPAENPIIPKPALETSVDVVKLAVPEKGRPGFEGLDASEHGLIPREKYQKPQKARIRETGNSGLAAGDVDGDGLVDLFVCGMDGPNVLYRNQGSWQFEDITAQAGVACKGWRMSGAVFADVDGDSDLDLITVSLRDGRNFLFLNDGKGTFTESLGINWVTHPRGGSVASALADVVIGALFLEVLDACQYELLVERTVALESAGFRKIASHFWVMNSSIWVFCRAASPLPSMALRV